MNIILDTNVLIAGILDNGCEKRILNLVRNNELKIVYSKDVLIEYMLAPTNMALKLVHKIEPKQIKIFAYQLSKTIANFIDDKATMIKVKSEGKYLKDSSDDKFINLAIDGNVKYIITVDEHLFKDIDVKNKNGEEVVVISPYQFEQLYRLQKRNWNSV